MGKKNVDPGLIPFPDGDSAYQQGWKAALDLLLPMKKNGNTAECSPSQASQEILCQIDNVIAMDYTT